MSVHRISGHVVRRHTVNNDSISPQCTELVDSAFNEDTRFVALHKLQERLLCIPAISAPVELGHFVMGVFMRAHRARMGPKVLSDLVYAKCNKHLQYGHLCEYVV